MKCPYCKKVFFAGNPRSNQQNRFYWSVVVGLIANHTGHAPQEIHEIIKNKFMSRKIIEIAGIKQEIPISTTELTTTQFQDYIEQVTAWAGQTLNVEIPKPKKYLLTIKN